jgi:hypothetical protein
VNSDPSAHACIKKLFWIAPFIFCTLAFSQDGALRLTEPKPAKDGTIFTSEPALTLKGTLASTGENKRVLRAIAASAIWPRLV